MRKVFKDIEISHSRALFKHTCKYTTYVEFMICILQIELPNTLRGSEAAQREILAIRLQCWKNHILVFSYIHTDRYAMILHKTQQTFAHELLKLYSWPCQGTQRMSEKITFRNVETCFFEHQRAFTSLYCKIITSNICLFFLSARGWGQIDFNPHLYRRKYPPHRVSL